jgi:hypothetical protein
MKILSKLTIISVVSISIFSAQSSWSQDLPAKVQGFFKDWTTYSVKSEDYAAFKGLDVNQMVAHLRKPENKVTVLILPFKPQTAEQNPTLKMENPAELAQDVSYFSDRSKIDFETWDKAIAQTLPPYVFNGLPEQWDMNRPGVSEFRINLGSAANRYTVAHEWTHVLFHQALFPAPITLPDGRKVHLYMAIHLATEEAWNKTNEIQTKVTQLENTPNANGEELYKQQMSLFQSYLKYRELLLQNELGNIEEIVVHYQNLIHASDLELSADDVSRSAWISLKYALDLNDFVDDFLKNDNIWQLLTNAKQTGQFDPSLVAPYQRVEESYQGVKKELFKHYKSLFPVLVKNKLNAHIAEMVRKGRLSIEPSGKR